MDAIEIANAMRGLAHGVRAFYEGLIEEKFDQAEALRLTAAYVAGMAGGKVG